MSILGQFQFRRDVASSWSSANPVLLSGELGLESDTNQFKIGDGVTSWNSLPYGGLVGSKGEKGDTGNTGLTGATGSAGLNGWSPVLAVVVDGARNVLQVVDWTGGQGTKPVVGKYIGASGFVDTVELGTNIRGQQGVSGLGSPATNAPASIAGSSALGSVTTRYALEDHTHAGVSSVSVNGGAAQTGAVSVNVPAVQHAVLTATQANTTVTEAQLTDHLFTLPPGMSATVSGILVFTGAGITTGAYYGIKVTQGAGANGNAVGSWQAKVNLSSAATATGLEDGDVFSLAGGATTPAGAGVLGTATVAGNNSAWLSCIVKNNSTNANTTIQVMFRSETAGSAVTAQIGTAATCIIG